MVTIRKAERKDCPSAMMELVRELALYEKAPEQVTVTMEHFEESGFGPNPVWWAFVAESDGVIAGHRAVLYPLFHLERQPHVPGRYRGNGELPRQRHRQALLFDRLAEEAKEKGFSGMVWQVLEWNEPAINFYKNTMRSSIRSGGMGALNCSIPGTKNGAHIWRAPFFIVFKLQFCRQPARVVEKTGL